MRKKFLKTLLIFIGIFFISTKVSADSGLSLINYNVNDNKVYKYDTSTYGNSFYEFTFNFKVSGDESMAGSPAVVYFDGSINGNNIYLDEAKLDGVKARTTSDKKTMFVIDILALGEYKGQTITRKVTFPYALLSQITRENNYSFNWRIYNAYDNKEVYASGKMTLADDPVAYVAPDTNTSAVENKSVYNFLAPIGKIKCMDSSGTADKDTGLDSNGCITNNIGTYLNFIFKLGIGLSAALAVLMLIMGGIMYMGNESVFGKTEAKHKMKFAVIGLLISLAAWALLNTINPDLTGSKGVSIGGAELTVTPLFDRGYNDPKQANGESIYCTPVTNPSSPCTVENLTKVFGASKAVAMSKICNMESRGVSQPSGTDVCKPGDKAFSFGLFQVNLSANGSLAGSDCVGLFDRAVAGKDAIEPKYNSGYTCSLSAGKENQYNICKNRLLDTNTNLAIAKSLLLNSRGIENWSGDKKYCASAFQ